MGDGFDSIEDLDGKLHACECKWNAGARQRIIRTFAKTHPGCGVAIVTRRNFIPNVTRTDTVEAKASDDVPPPGACQD